MTCIVIIFFIGLFSGISTAQMRVQEGKQFACLSQFKLVNKNIIKKIPIIKHNGGAQSNKNYFRMTRNIRSTDSTMFSLRLQKLVFRRF